MNPLKRNNPGVRATDHENRIEVLERRIIPNATVWAFAQAPTQTIAPGSATLTLDTFWTSDQQVFRTNTNTAGDTQILTNEFGVFVVTLTVEWEDIGADYPHQCSIGELRLIGANLAALGASAVSASVLQYPPTGTNGPLDTGDVSIGVHSPWDYTENQPAGWSISVNNQHSASVDVERANLMVAWLPSDEPDADYVVY